MLQKRICTQSRVRASQGKEASGLLTSVFQPGADYECKPAPVLCDGTGEGFVADVAPAVWELAFSPLGEAYG